MTDYLIECCANSLQSAINGEKGGSNRTELCSNLRYGGLTPNKKDIALAKETLTHPLHILIRPRVGNFIYSKNEITRILSDIKFCKKIGCNGIAIGALDKNGDIDINNLKKMIETARPMHITFHRAFDEGNSIIKNLEKIIECNCDTVLTAGYAENVNDGFNNFKHIIKVAKGNINIMAGSGVNHKNINKLKDLGITNFHLSGKRINKNGMIETDSKNISKLINNLLY